MSTRIWRHVERGHCGFCGHRHTLEVEYRCVGCDREVCALCLVTVRETREGYCPHCVPEAGSDADVDADADPDGDSGPGQRRGRGG